MLYIKVLLFYFWRRDPMSLFYEILLLWNQFYVGVICHWQNEANIKHCKFTCLIFVTTYSWKIQLFYHDDTLIIYGVVPVGRDYWILPASSLNLHPDNGQVHILWRRYSSSSCLSSTDILTITSWLLLKFWVLELQNLCKLIVFALLRCCILGWFFYAAMGN